MEAPELTIDKNALFADKRAQFEKGISEGRSVKELTLELGIPKSTAYQWKNARTDDDDERRDPQPVAPPAVETTKRGRGRGKGKVSVRPITEETAGLLCAGLFMIPAMMQNEPDWLLSDVEKASLAGPFADSLRVMPAPVADAINTYSAPGIFLTSLTAIVVRKQKTIYSKRNPARTLQQRPGAPIAGAPTAAPRPPGPPTPAPQNQNFTEGAPVGNSKDDIASAFQAAKGSLQTLDESDDSA